MTFQHYENLFREKAEQAGYSEENIQKCLYYANPLIERGIPVIYNTSNLSALVGYNKLYLKKAALYTNSFYRKFSIKKRNGKKRELKEPLPSLKEIQLWILENILYEIPISKYAKAYIRNRNINDNVRFHRNKEKVLNLDIENFFPSIKRNKIEKIFLNLNYSSNISNLLSKLCCCDECLPQGAPTSPYLSNLYLNKFDEVVASYCKKNNIRYTRYADDLTFSGNFEYEVLIELIKAQLFEIDLKLNAEKTLIMERNVRQIVTGIIVNKVIQVPKTYRDSIRQEVYYLQKFGLSDHIKKINSNKANYIHHLLGKINYTLNVNPKDKEMKKYKVIVKEYLPNNISKIK